MPDCTLFLIFLTLAATVSVAAFMHEGVADWLVTFIFRLP